MNLIWSSNAPWTGTGYGQQTDLFAPRLRDLGHNTALVAFYGLHGAPLEWNGMKVYPGGVDAWGNDVLAAFAAHHFEGNTRDGWVITLQDVWTLQAQTLQEIRLATWAPVDHKPVPPPVLGFFQKFGAVAIAMSKFGQEELRKQDINALYVPHGVDTKVYRPRERNEVRDILGIPRDAFLAGMVAANKGNSPPRKAFSEVFTAFAKFKKRNPDALLFMHTLRTDGHGGCDLRHMALMHGIEDAVVWTDQFHYMAGLVSQEQMAQLYSTFDVLLNPSYGEGFGVPIIEAQACGTPVIVADNTAMPELCGSGWVVPCEPFWDERQKSYYGRVVVSELEKALEKAYHASAQRRREARAFAEQYDADRVTQEHWVPVLNELEQLMEPPKVEARPVDLAAIG